MHVRLLDRILRHVQAVGGPDGPTDRELLAGFAAGDRSAFTPLLERHGPSVLAVCRRELRNDADAEDAFQATFLVLARKAGAVRWGPSAAGWLFETACRVCSELKRSAARRSRREGRAEPPRPEQPPAAALRAELAAVLHEEVNRLPAASREAVLLCLVEGLTRDEAARRLGCSLTAVKHRLERGRERLRWRLARRGWDLSAALLIGTGVTVSQTLAEATRQAVRPGSHPAPGPAALADGISRGPSAWKAKAGALLGGVTGLLGVAGALPPTGPPCL